MSVKLCSKCKQEPAFLYHGWGSLCSRKASRKWRRDHPNGSKNHNLLARHGITLIEYRAILKHQNGRCKICLGKEKDKRHKYLSVDHNHQTNKIRGLLCNRCNRALGLFQDDCWVLQRAVKYLRKKL